MQTDESANQDPKNYESGDEDVYESVTQLQGPKPLAVFDTQVAPVQTFQPP
jgi:hypothetical protein